MTKEAAKAKAKAKGGGKQVRVTLLRSRFGRTPGHAQCAAGLGLRHRHQSVLVQDTPENRGMIATIGYMLRVEEV